MDVLVILFTVFSVRTINSIMNEYTKHLIINFFNNMLMLVVFQNYAMTLVI